MTNTQSHTSPAQTGKLGARTSNGVAAVVGLLSRESGETLIDQIARSVAARIDDRLLRGGARMPSIRQFAATHGVSAFTVVASYDKLVARGYLESRRGAGFYVRERAGMVLRADQAGHAHVQGPRERPGGAGAESLDRFEAKPID